jgi:hypothetical protein
MQDGQAFYSALSVELFAPCQNSPNRDSGELFDIYLFTPENEYKVTGTTAKLLVKPLQDVAQCPKAE